MNPEFLREGVAVEDFLNPDRIVVGGIDERSRDVMAQLYAPFNTSDVVRTTPTTAELIKYTANSLLATLISFSNEIGNVAKAVGVDVTEVLAGVHLDHRFAPLLRASAAQGERVRPAMLTYLEAGCGFGGSCFPKDVKALVAHAESVGVPVPVLRGALEVNEDQPLQLVEMLAELPTAAKVVVLGIAFKPGTDDIRESPALRVVPALVAKGYVVTVHDPIAMANARLEFGDSVSYEESLDMALEGADAVVLVTSWPEYANLQSHLGAEQPLVVDGRRFLNPADYSNYKGIGYPERSAT
jgi:UDPglucose 6-dehydrogenase/GDP-mannose 6-dehydrogenase